MKNVKVKAFIAFACFVVVEIFLFVGLIVRPHVMGEHELYAQTASDVPFGEISPEHSLAVSLHFEETVQLDRISIMLATYARENTCEVDFYLYKNGETVYSYTVENASVISDNSYFDLNNINITIAPEDEVYLLITSPNGSSENTITVWMLSNEAASGTYAYNFVDNEGIAVAQSAVLLLYGGEFSNKYIFAAAAATIIYLIVFLLKGHLWSCFSKSKLAIWLVDFRGKSCSQTIDVVCLLATMFFCCGILQSACFSQHQIPPLIPVVGCLLILLIDIFFKQITTRSLTVFSIVFTFAVNTLLLLEHTDILKSGFLYDIRGLLYYIIVFLLCIAMPVIFVRELVMDFLLRLATAVKSRVWLVLCAVTAVGGGILIELEYSQAVGENTVIRRGWFFAAVLFVVIAFFVKRNELLRSPEKLYLLIALPIGIYMAVFAPLAPGVVWDGEIHYRGSVALAQGTQVEYIESDLALINGRYSIDDFSESQTEIKKQSLQEYYQSGNVIVMENWMFSTSTALGYLPGALGIIAGKILRLSYPTIFIFGRLGKLLCYVIAVYYSIKRLINGKILLMVIALIPTNLFLASSYSYDSWLTSMTIVSFSYFWGALQRSQDKITFQECVIILGAMCIGVPVKYIYFTLFFMLFLIPKEKFSDKKAWKRFLLVVIICVIAFLAVTLLVSYGSDSGRTLTDVRGGTEVNGMMQTLYILKHPFTYAKTLITFLHHYLALDKAYFYISYFGYMGLVNMHTFFMVMMFVAAMTDCVEVETLSQKIHFRVLSALILYATAALIATTLYIAFTPVGHSTVNGCQPRYLLPLVFPFFAFLFHHGTNFNGNRIVYNGVFFALSFYGVALTIWDVYVSRLIP